MIGNIFFITEASQNKRVETYWHFLFLLISFSPLKVAVSFNEASLKGQLKKTSSGYLTSKEVESYYLFLILSPHY